MTKPKQVKNIAELADIAGVTAGTVSRALSGKGFVSEKTRERIRALAQKHRFRPNTLARNLRTQRTGAVTVLIPLGHEQAQHLSDPFFMTIIGHLADGLTERGYELILSKIIPNSDDWLEAYIESGRADGVIVIGQSDQAEILDRAAKNYLPLVAWGGYYPGQSHCSVGSDNFLGGALAANHLVEQGCKKIAFFGDPVALEIRQRLEGCQDALAKHGAKYEPRIFPIHLDAELSDEDISNLLDTDGFRPDGIVAASDVIAMSAVAALAEHDIDVPGDVKIIGYDDLPIATQTSPRLTTIRQDLKDGARQMVECLVKRIAGEETASIVMKPELIVRRST
ncbi:MAG: LacI family DNA-binding transcriptional regulator [Pseudomonadota bacterium]